jgi:ribonuclease HII
MMIGDLETQLLAGGTHPVGVDEVGRGCIAGPVYAAAVMLDYIALASLSDQTISLVRDSKTLSGAERRKILTTIKACAVRWEVGSATVSEIEEHGIVEATFLAMRRALKHVADLSQLVLVDGNTRISKYRGLQQSVVKGDNKVYAIAAASIIAKEARDDYMRTQSEAFPHYGFDQHVGYGTKAHLETIERFGICHLHRRNFSPISGLVDERTKYQRV